MMLFSTHLNSIVAAVFGLQAMSEFNLSMLHQIQDALVEIKPLFNIGNARISADSVKRVNEITARLSNDIIKKD